MGVVRTKDSVEFKMIAPGGYVLLAAIAHAAQQINHDVTITSGTDGCHSGEHDPHHRGEAYDVRTHDLSPEDQQTVLAAIQQYAGPAFFAFLEAAGTDNEHIHCQVRKGTEYPAPVVA